MVWLIVLSMIAIGTAQEGGALELKHLLNGDDEQFG